MTEYFEIAKVDKRKSPTEYTNFLWVRSSLILSKEIRIFSLTGSYSMQLWTAITRNGVIRKRSINILKNTGKLFKNLQIKGAS